MRVEEERGSWEVRGRMGEGRNHYDVPHIMLFRHTKHFKKTERKKMFYVTKSEIL